MCKNFYCRFVSSMGVNVHCVWGAMNGLAVGFVRCEVKEIMYTK